MTAECKSKVPANFSVNLFVACAKLRVVSSHTVVNFCKHR